MNTLLTLENSFEPIVIEGDFNSNAQAIENAAARGMQFLVSRKPNGAPVGIAMHKILTIDEIEED